ncbi:MAG: hypothetical protein ACUZ77_10245 [Candidatus Brocadiales bacterium]
MLKVLEGTYEDGKVTLSSEIEGIKKAKLLVIVLEELKREVTDEDYTKAIERLKKKNPFSYIKDPVLWQRETRRDRELPD